MVSTEQASLSSDGKLTAISAEIGTSGVGTVSISNSGRVVMQSDEMVFIKSQAGANLWHTDPSEQKVVVSGVHESLSDIMITNGMGVTRLTLTADYRSRGSERLPRGLVCVCVCVCVGTPTCVWEFPLEPGSRFLISLNQ